MLETELHCFIGATSEGACVDLAANAVDIAAVYDHDVDARCRFDCEIE